MGAGMSLTIERSVSAIGVDLSANVGNAILSLNASTWTRKVSKLALINSQLKEVEDTYLKASAGAGALTILQNTGSIELNINAWVDEGRVEIITDCQDSKRRLILAYWREGQRSKVEVIRVTLDTVERSPVATRPFGLDQHAKWLIPESGASSN